VEPGPAFDPATAGERGRRARPDEEALGALADEEGALHLDDLLLRRAGLGDDPAALRALAPRVAARRGWPPERAAAELSRLEAALAGAVQ
jgi:glycerol-3-phosphate dehydrogenase